MSTLQSALAVLNVLALYLLWVRGFKPALLDVYRNHLFRIRDELFDLGRSGALDFGSREYKQVRAVINSRIRYAQRLTLLDIVAVGVLNRDLSGAADREAEYTDRLVDGIPSAVTRIEVRKLLNRADTASVRYFLRTTPLLWLPYLVSYLLRLFKGLRSVVLSRIEHYLDLLALELKVQIDTGVGTTIGSERKNGSEENRSLVPHY